MTQPSVLITGANRGLGLEYVKSYLASGEKVIACCRAPEAAEDLQQLKDSNSELEILTYDAGSEDSLKSLVAELGQRPIKTLIANAGVYGGKGQVMGNISSDVWLETLRINSIAPYLLIEALVPNLEAADSPTAVVMSSKMGSIDDNSSGGGYIYRSSKTAVNSVVKSLSIDLEPKGIRVLALHPGWVRTDMGGPNGLIDTQTSIAGLRQTIDRKQLSDTGKFYNYDGSLIPW